MRNPNGSFWTDSLPEFLKHNELILSYYRSEWPLKQTILSIFSIHNETLDIWTHLIGFFIFLLLTAYASCFPCGLGTQCAASCKQFVQQFHSFPKIVESRHNPAPGGSATSTRWPFYLYCIGAMFCLLMSSACHLLSCHSARTCYLMLRLDCAGISALIISTFYPLVYYSFACRPFFLHLYLCSFTVFGAATVAVSLLPAFETPRFRLDRSVLFACMGLSGLVPFSHKMVAFGHRQEAVLTTGYEAAMGMFYGLGVVVYAMMVPERWLPGRFDIAGQSHQFVPCFGLCGSLHVLPGQLGVSWLERPGRVLKG